MMQYIRDRATSKFAKFLFLGIGISFLGFGGSSFIGNLGDPTVAKVNGEKISTRMLSNAYSNYLQSKGGVLPEGEVASTAKNQVLNGLIQEMVISQAANKMGIVSSDEQLRDLIMTSPVLQDADGNFDRKLYQGFLQQQGLTSELWEANMRQQLTLQLLVSAIGNSVIVTETNLEDFAKVDREKRDLAIIRLPLSDYTNTVDVTDEMIAEYYAQNQANYVADPKVKLSYVTLPELDTSSVTVSDDEVNQHIAALVAKQQANETRSSDQLIIQFSTDAERDAALDQLNQIYTGLMAGTLSYDDAKAKVTALPDGLFFETGVVRKNAQMQNVDEALFAMNKDAQYAEPIVSDNAVHLIHLLNVNDGSDISSEALFAESKAELLKAKKEALNADNVQKFQEVAEKNSDSLDLLAEDFQIKPVTTDWLSLTEKPAELSDANTYQVATQEMVLTGGKNSEAYHTDDQQIRILRVAAYEDARPLTLDEAKDDIRETLTALAAKKQIDAVVEKMNEALQSSDQTLDQIAEAESLTLEHYNDVDRFSILEIAQSNPSAIEAIIKGFDIQKGESKSLHNYLMGDSVYAIAVNEVTPGVLSDYSEDEIVQLRERLKADMAQAETVLFMQGLYDQGKIEIYQVPFLTE